MERTRAVLLAAEGLAQLLAAVSALSAKPPLYGALVALLVWAMVGGEPARAVAPAFAGYWRKLSAWKGPRRL